MALTERERAMLEYERSWWALDASRDEAIPARFELSVERYTQLLYELIDRPEALEADPMVVRRLQRARERRHRERAELHLSTQRRS
jgi:hypothetical protein